MAFELGSLTGEGEAATTRLGDQGLILLNQSFLGVGSTKIVTAEACLAVIESIPTKDCMVAGCPKPVGIRLFLSGLA